MVKLVDLPPELINAILCLPDLSVGAIRLWMSGNPLLQRQISTGLTEVSLSSVFRFGLCRLPHFLTQLRALRVLVVDRAEHPLLCPTSNRQVIQKLSSTLQTLILNYPHSDLHFTTQAPKEDSEGSDSETSVVVLPDGPVWSLDRAFPDLKTLRFFGGDLNLKEPLPWPSCLTDLSCDTIHDAEDFVRSLPRGLLRLNWQGCQDPDHSAIWPLLPPGLTWYSTPMFGDGPEEGFDYSTLPRSLTKMKSFYPDELPASSYAQLPPSLTTLSTFSLEAPFQGLTAMTALKKLLLSSSGIDSEVFRFLPSLTDLSFSALDLESFRGHMDWWPKGLTKLNFGSRGHNDSSSLDLLPPTLKELTLYRPCVTFQGLPPSLLTFTTLGGWTSGEPPILPPNLTSLHLQILKGQKNFVWSEVPKTLTYLAATTTLPASQIKFLPKRLTGLSCTEIALDDDFDPSNFEEIDAMRKVWELGRQQRMCDFLDCDPLPQVTFAGLLPRTLRTLSFGATALAETTMEWCHMLPPCLAELWIYRGNILPDFLYKAPLKHVNALGIRLKLPTDDHIAALPRFGTQLVTICDGSLLTRKAALYYPASAELPSGCRRVSNMIRRLRDRMWDSQQDEDTTLMRRLGSGQDDDYFDFLEQLSSGEEDIEEEELDGDDEDYEEDEE